MMDAVAAAVERWKSPKIQKLFRTTVHKKGGLLKVQQPNFSRNQQTFQDHFLIQSSTFLEINKLFRITLWSKTQLFVNIHFRITLHGPTFKTSIQNLVFQVCRDEVVGWLLPPITSPGRRWPKSLCIVCLCICLFLYLCICVYVNSHSVFVLRWGIGPGHPPKHPQGGADQSQNQELLKSFPRTLKE